MSSHVLRAAVLGAVVSAAGPALATAAPVRVSPSGVLDASSDGQLLLLRNGSVLDRTTGATALVADPDQNLDLALRSPITLQRSLDGYIYVRDAVLEALGSVDPSGVPVTATSAVLVRDGRGVVFTTAGATPTIIERDMVTNTSTVRVTNATLLDASEDGKVITFSRALPAIARPSGAAISGQPSSPIPSLALGYQVAGGAPRLVDQTRYAERASGATENGCPTSVVGELRQVVDLQVSQEGAAGGRYVLTEQTTNSSQGGALFSRTFTRLGAGEATQLYRTDPSIGSAVLTTDPVSGAYVITTSPRASAGTSSARMTADDGRTFTLPVPSAGVPARSTPLYQNVVPFSRGAGAAADVQIYAMPQGPFPESSGAWVDDALGAVGASTTPWASLPREGDGVLPASLASDQTWVTCDGVPGAPADYAAIQVATTGNSAGTVGVRLTPVGKVPAKVVSATVTWYGLPIWSRTAKADATLRLPAILPNVPGYRVDAKITLASGTVLTESAALRRTR